MLPILVSVMTTYDWYHGETDGFVKQMDAGGCLNTKMSSSQYRDPHVKDKMVLWPSLMWESPYLGKTVFILRWALGSISQRVYELIIFILF